MAPRYAPPGHTYADQASAIACRPHLETEKKEHSFLKDLATLRSPQSSITFLSYLHAKNRLVDFINRGNTTPTRKEYSDYLAYVAQHVQDEGIKVAYGEDVIGIEEEREGTVQIHSRVLTTGETTIRRASQCPMHRNIAMRINRELFRKFDHFAGGRALHPAVYQGPFT